MILLLLLWNGAELLAINLVIKCRQLL